MLIENYGLFWRRNWVHWGWQNNNGHLKGVLASAKKGAPADFCEQQGVYCLYDDSFRLVYVGQAGGQNQKLLKRLGQHREDAVSERWSRFSWFGVRRVIGPPDQPTLKAVKASAKASVQAVLDHIEAILIAAAEPVHNKQSGRFGPDVQQYLQHRDSENLGPTSEEMIRELWKRAR